MTKARQYEKTKPRLMNNFAHKKNEPDTGDVPGVRVVED
jgi:hypothetical protein